MKLDKEQKKTLKGLTVAWLGMVAGTLIYYACSGKLLEDWADALIISAIHLLIVVVLGSLLIVGSRIPKN
ncbi:MAG: hypothetical protein IKI85_07980 [Bacteroidales bacterium]|jgi:hypothetical protein|nr:hypothetical protein [Bacteroidales bacterium]